MVKDTSIDDVRAFWDSRPCNIRHSKAEVGTAKYFYEVTERRYFVEPHIISFCDFPRWRGQSVLEIGCGIGTDAEQFAKFGANYTGIELSKNSLQLAIERFNLNGLEGEFLQLDAETCDNYSFNKKFDLIYSFGVLHHTLSIERALQAIYNIATSGTRVKIMVYAKNSYKQAMINEGLDQPEAQYGCPIANSYSVIEALELFTKSGFSDVKITQDHIFPYKIPEYRKFEYVKEPYFEVMPSEVFVALKKNFGWHLLIDAIKK